LELNVVSRDEIFLFPVYDHRFLTNMFRQSMRHDHSMMGLLARKLRGAVVVVEDTISPGVVTLNSRVVFRVNGGEPEERVIIHDRRREIPGMTQPIDTLRALALVGLSEGQAIVVETRMEKTMERLFVESVPYQPEAALRVRRAPRDERKA
jgi:regulator of nucleoside diphosphate kinase